MTLILYSSRVELLRFSCKILVNHRWKVQVGTEIKGEPIKKGELIKNHLRNTMGQDRLSALAILSIEHKLLKTVDFSDIISRFADQKKSGQGFLTD